ncbi:MAG: hypothetical protein R2940_12860 [Syntrophotaleaceae bacterium]
MIRGSIIGFLMLLLALAGCAPGGPAPVRFVFSKAGHLQSSGLTEASGLAASRRHPGVLWAVNDSGNQPLLFAFDQRGVSLGEVLVKGAANVDWEDLAAFSWRGENWLLVADVGDNRGQRPLVVLHFFREPVPDSKGRFAGEIRPAWSLSLTYPEGPRDCEAVAVDEKAGKILLLSKRTEPPVLYELPLEIPASDHPVVATPVALLETIPPPASFDLLLPHGQFRSQPTAMDLSPDGGTLLVLTYRHAYLFRRQKGETWIAILARQPQKVELPDLFALPQREAACFSADGMSWFVTSEGEGAGIYRVSAESAGR